MEIKELNNGVIVKNIEDFHPVDTFECGQCFRWNRVGENRYIGVAHGQVLEVDYRDGDLTLYNITLEDFYHRWMDYFDLRRDYGAIQEKLFKDRVLREAIPHGRGIRLLNQDEWETTISFIISSNKNIPHIKVIIEHLCQNYGQAIHYKGRTYYTFPSPQELQGVTIEGIAQTKCGYRAKYIHAAVQRMVGGEVDLYGLSRLPTQEARQELLNFYGIGPKIADCILLFSMGKYETFPTDVWVKRVMERYYFDGPTSIKSIQEFAREKWGGLAGFAQQYLFHYIRNK